MPLITNAEFQHLNLESIYVSGTGVNGSEWADIYPYQPTWFFRM